MSASGRFKSSQSFEVREAGSTAENDVRVVKLAGDGGMQVQNFAPQALANRGRGEYPSIKKKFGPIAATDPDRHSKSRKDSRFSMNELLRGPLAVEEEERKIIEEKVRVRVTAVTDEATARAHDKGYQDGLKKGFEEAYAKTREEAAGKVTEF